MIHKCKCRTRVYKDILFSFDMKHRRLLEFYSLIFDFFSQQNNLTLQHGKRLCDLRTKADLFET